MCMDGVTGLVASLMSLSRPEWEWGSMMPGVSHRPVASTVAAEEGASTVAPTPAIFPACTQTEPCDMVPWLAVMTVAFLKTMSVDADCGAFCATASAAQSGARIRHAVSGGTRSGRCRCIEGCLRKFDSGWDDREWVPSRGQDANSFLGGMLQHFWGIAYWRLGVDSERRAEMMASAIRPASTAGRTVWTRTTEAPLRMEATMAAMLA